MTNGLAEGGGLEMADGFAEGSGLEVAHCFTKGCRTGIQHNRDGPVVAQHGVNHFSEAGEADVQEEARNKPVKRVKHRRHGFTLAENLQKPEPPNRLY